MCHTHAHTMPKGPKGSRGTQEAGGPCPVPVIFRVFTVWKRYSQEDECVEEAVPPKQAYPPTSHGSQPGQRKGLRATIPGLGSSSWAGAEKVHSGQCTTEGKVPLWPWPTLHSEVLRRHCSTHLCSHPGPVGKHLPAGFFCTFPSGTEQEQ